MDINSLSSRTIFRVLLMIAAFIGLGLLVFRLHRELVWVLTAFFLAVALNPAVEYLTRFMPKKNRGLAVGVVLVLTLTIVTLVVVKLTPPLVSQTEGFVKGLPGLADQIQNSNTGLGGFIRHHNLSGFIRSEQTQLASKLSSLSLPVVEVASSIVKSIIATLTVLVLTLFMLLEGPKQVQSFWRLHPPHVRRHRQKLAEDMYKAVTGYVTGNLFASVLAGAAAAIVLSIVGIPFAIPLGVVVAIFSLIPLLGHPLSGLVVSLFALSYGGLTRAVIMAVFFVVYSQLESHILRPLVYARTVKMSALFVLISVILGTALAGLIGAILAIPVAASAQVLLKDYFVRHPRT